jgi:hypothetical protein
MEFDFSFSSYLILVQILLIETNALNWSNHVFTQS